MTARSAELLQNELDRFETLLADLLEISRFDAGAAVLDLEDVNLGDVAHRVVASPGRWPSSGARSSSSDPRHAVHGRGRRTPGRADRAQPRHQRDRPRRLQRRRHPRGRRRPRDRAHRPRPRRRAAARRGRDGLQPVLAGRPGAGPDHRRHRPGPVDRAGGRAAARRLAPGVGPPGGGRAVPADAAAPRRRRADAQPAAAGPRGHRGGRSDERRRATRAGRPVVVRGRGAARWPRAASRTARVRSGRRDRPRAGADEPQGAVLQPAGAAAGCSPAAIVNGFLVAMQANPLRPTVGRQFLSEGTRAWEPNRGTVIYARGLAAAGRRGCGPLGGISRLDARGGWRGGCRAADVADIPVVVRGRPVADRPRPNALVVPTRSSSSFGGSPSTSSTRPGGCCCRTRSSSRAASRPPRTWSAACSPVPGRSWAGHPQLLPRGPPLTSPSWSPRRAWPRCRCRGEIRRLPPGPTS